MGRDPGVLESFRQTHPAEDSCQINILYIPYNNDGIKTIRQMIVVKLNVRWNIYKQWLSAHDFNESTELVPSILLQGRNKVFICTHIDHLKILTFI